MPFVVLAILCAAWFGLMGSAPAHGQGAQYGSPPPYDAAAYVRAGASPSTTDVHRPWVRAKNPGSASGIAKPDGATEHSIAENSSAETSSGASNVQRELLRPAHPHGDSAVMRRAAITPPVDLHADDTSPSAGVQPVSYRSAPATADSQASSPGSHAISPRNLRPAAENGEGQREGAAPAIDPARSLATMAGGLAVVIGLFLLTLWWWRKRMPQAILPLPGGVLEVLGRSSLDGKHRLHLVRLGNKLLLVSTTAEGAHTLAEIEDPDEVTRLMGLCLQGRPGSSSRAFRDVLTELAQDGFSGRDTRHGSQDERAHLQAALRRAREANLG